jgi:hypothetical protein
MTIKMSQNSTATSLVHGIDVTETLCGLENIPDIYTQSYYSHALEYNVFHRIS